MALTNKFDVELVTGQDLGSEALPSKHCPKEYTGNYIRMRIKDSVLVMGMGSSRLTGGSFADIYIPDKVAIELAKRIVEAAGGDYDF